MFLYDFSLSLSLSCFSILNSEEKSSCLCFFFFFFLTNTTENDPCGQFEWMKNELQEARNDSAKVYLMAHIMPGLVSFFFSFQISLSRSSLSSECKNKQG